MKRLLLLWLSLFLYYSCTFSNGISVGNGGYASYHLYKLSLKYDFSKEFQTGFILNDYLEFMNYHNIMSNSSSETFSGEINSLLDILCMVDAVPEESRKPSITLTLNCLDTTIVKKFASEDVSACDLYNIPNRTDVYTGTIEIKSYKTYMYGLQVIWNKTASGPNWPINEFVQDGKIHGTAPGVIKVGTNNANGNIAARGGYIISNTEPKLLQSRTIDNEIKYVVDQNVPISPSLSGNVYIGGDFSKEVVWDAPVIYKAI